MVTPSSPPKNYRTDALVLRTQPLGETDRIIIFATRSYGIVHAVAKGVRKGNSKFGGRLEPFMYVDVALVAGRQLHTVSQVQTRRAYTASLMADYEAFAAATAIAELAENLLRYDADDTGQFFDLLVGALSVLARNLHDPLDIWNAFVLRSMRYAGWGFSLKECAVCSASLESAWFSHEAGLIGEECARSSRLTVQSPVSEDVVIYLSALLEARWDRVDPVAHTDEAQQSYRILKRYIQWQLEKPLKSLSLLEKEV